MITLLLAALLIVSAPAIFVGTLVLYHVLIRKKQAPCDESNRIAHLRLVWFAVTREREFAGLQRYYGRPDKMYAPAFPWLTKDEWENQ